MKRPGAIAAVALALAGCGSASPAAAPPPRVLAVRVPAGPLAADRATAVGLGGGRALTVAHVLRARRPVFVGGRRARVLSVDRRLDLAVLAVPALSGRAPAWAAARAGERVTVRALRGALPAVVRRVVTANVNGRVRPALELAAGVAPGDSGAPVLTRDGRIAGLVFASAAAGPPVAYAVQVSACATSSRRSTPRSSSSASSSAPRSASSC
jgi:S1-C subfamily serine protease